MEMRFVLLGSGAVRNNPRRAGPSQILQIGERVLMFDCTRLSFTAARDTLPSIATVRKISRARKSSACIDISY